MKRIEVAVPGHEYGVVIGAGAFDHVGAAVAALGASKVALVTHKSLARAFPQVRAGIEATGIEVVEATIPEGEKAKSWATVGDLLETCVAGGLHRDDAVVGLGGGVATDTAGFVAAALYRGVRWIGCSTTVLGAVDASVGGKTGVNLSAGKNLAGAFWQPSGVYVDTSALARLDARQVRSGLSEAAKCGFISDTEILADLGALDPEPTGDTISGQPDVIEDVISRGVSVKAQIVAADEREGGVRAFLNYGHTLGHALERASGFKLTHGEAISIGMVFAAEFARALGMLSESAVARHREVLARIGLPMDAKARDLDAARDFLNIDKKVLGGERRWVLLEELGTPVIVSDPDPAALERALDAVSA